MLNTGRLIKRSVGVFLRVGKPPLIYPEDCSSSQHIADQTAEALLQQASVEYKRLRRARS